MRLAHQVPAVFPNRVDGVGGLWDHPALCLVLIVSTLARLRKFFLSLVNAPLRRSWSRWLAGWLPYPGGTIMRLVMHDGENSRIDAQS